MLLQTNSYIVPKDKRSEHTRLMRRFRQVLARLGCDHFEVYEQVGNNWASGDSSGRVVQIMRFHDRKHQMAVQNAERNDPAAQELIAEFCALVNFPYQQQQGYFAVGFYSSVLPAVPARVRSEVDVQEEGEFAAPQPVAQEPVESLMPPPLPAEPMVAEPNEPNEPAVDAEQPIDVRPGDVIGEAMVDALTESAESAAPADLADTVEGLVVVDEASSDAAETAPADGEGHAEPDEPHEGNNGHVAQADTASPDQSPPRAGEVIDPPRRGGLFRRSTERGRENAQ